MIPTPADIARRTRPPAPPAPAPVPKLHSGPPRTDAALHQPGVHDCPVDGCDVLVSPGLIACRTHWLAIPKHRRARLVPTFQNRTADPAAYDTAVRIARELVITYAPRRSA